MPIADDINRVFRDFVRFSGDGKPNAPVGAPLPIGDPRSGVQDPSKFEIRDILLAILQTMGNPEALETLIGELRTRRIASTANSNFSGTTFPPGAETVVFRNASNTHIWQLLSTAPIPVVSGKHQQDAQGRWWERVFQASDTTPSYPNRAAAEAGAPSLPTSATQMFVTEGTALVIRSRTASADDPMFATGARWGVVQRIDASAVDARSTPSYASRAAAVTGVVQLPTAVTDVLVREGTALVIRSRFATVDDPLFPTSPQWGVVLRQDVSLITPRSLSITAGSSSLDRNANTWITPPVYRTVTAAEINGAPASVAVPATASVETMVAPGGTRTRWRDQSGRIFERTSVGSNISPWVEIPSTASMHLDNSARVAGDAAAQQRIGSVELAQQEGFARRPLAQSMGRGDYAPAVTMDGMPILAFDRRGQARFVVDDWVLADIATRLDLSGGGGGGSPVSPDVLGNIDGWNAWQADGLTTFTADLGDGPREYVMREGEDAWVNGRSQVAVRLLYGDEMGSAGASVATLENAFSVATLNDTTGQAGLNGTVPLAPVTGIQRAGAGFAATAGDFWVSAQAVARWVLARAESVAGATLTQLATGQPLSNLSRALTEAERILPEYRRTAIAETVSILHGAGDDSASYGSDLLALMQAINVEIGARRINLYQPSGTTERSNFASAEGTLQAFRDKGSLPVTLVSPTYWCGIAAGTIGVIDSASMTMLAELEAQAALDLNWIAPLAFYAERAGNVINIDFEVMPGVSLVAPTTGLVLTGATMSSAMIVADPVTGRLTRLCINLTSTPSGVVTVRYCRGPGPRFSGDLRDNWSAPSVTGGTLYRHAFTFQFEV